MAQRNPAREIAYSLIAAVVFGVGIYLYLANTMPKPEEVKAPVPMVAPSAERPDAPLRDRAGSIAQRFITALREKRFRDAHAMTVRVYQNTVSVSDFQAAIESSPYMATAKEVNFIRVSQQTLTREGGDIVLGPVLGRGMLVADHGNVDVSVTLVPEEDTLHVLSFVAAGVPIFKAMVQLE